jgi:hypothetical protein
MRVSSSLPRVFSVVRHGPAVTLRFFEKPSAEVSINMLEKEWQAFLAKVATASPRKLYVLRELTTEEREDFELMAGSEASLEDQEETEDDC